MKNDEIAKGWDAERTKRITIPAHQHVDEKQVSEMICRAVQTLRNDRHHGRGIPYVKIGKSVRYNVKDVLDFMESRKIHTEN